MNRLTGTLLRLTGLQTFPTISLNNPVYGQQSIVEITRYKLKTFLIITSENTTDISVNIRRTNPLVLGCSHLRISTRKTNMFVFLELMLMRK